MTCNAMVIEQVKREIVKREEIRKAKEQAADRAAMDQLDTEIAELQAKMDQYIKDEEDFHATMSDSQAQTHNHPHLNLDS